MSKPATIKIETQVLINGTPANNFTVDELYAKISEQQKAIKDLEAIDPKPQRLVKEIAARQDGVAELVKYIDSLPE